MSAHATKKRHTASMEDYLEAIVVLRAGNMPVRVSQISKALGVTMPSVSAALKKLSEDGLVEHERYGYVTLTTKGSRVAGDVFRRHETVRQFLSEVLSLDPYTAEEDACKIEHTLSPDTVRRLSKFVEFVAECPCGEPEWLKGFNYYVEHGEHPPQGCKAKCQEQ